ncbi:MAG TPA: WYL domain-containing protein [Pirellulaceae bacterium]|nr:WYL domain-containing protein [Pirellulaceae bacterium]
MNLKRIHRLIKLISLLQGGRGQNVSSLAAECDVTRRTIFRDLDVLKVAGVPLIYNDPEKSYRLAGAQLLPPTNFSQQEALAIVVLCYEMGGDGRLPFQNAARSAALKIENNLPARLREELRVMADAVQIRLPSVQHIEGHTETYQMLVQALRERRFVRIRYDSYADRELIQTKLSPYRLLFHNHSWYVIGRSSLHCEVRTFNVSRIRHAELLEENYKVPANFSLERYLGNAWRLIRDDGPDQEVLIRFHPLVAKNVAEVCWHRTQATTFNDDGSLDFRVRVSGLDEISWWILGYGDQAEVIEPAALREKIIYRITRMAEQYGIGKK